MSNLVKKIEILIPIFVFILLTLGLTTFITHLRKTNQETPYPITTPTITPMPSPTPASLFSNLVETTDWFQFEYPPSFIIAKRENNYLQLTENKWKDYEANIPKIDIFFYEDISNLGNDARSWLEAVGDPNPPIATSEHKVCSKLLTGECKYKGVSNIQETIIADYPGLKFDSESPSTTSKHTVIAFKKSDGITALVDIQMIITGLSSPDDQTPWAYNTIVGSLKINPQGKKINGKYIYIEKANLWLNENGKKKQLTFDADIPKTRLKLSPDNHWVAFIKKTTDSKKGLYVMQLGKKEELVAQDAAAVYYGEPYFDWSFDGYELYYLTSNGTSEFYQVWGRNTGSGLRKRYGEIKIKGGCGGGTPDIADHLAEKEGLSQLYSPYPLVFLSGLNGQILYTTNCTGRGLAIFDLKTGKEKILHDQAGKAVFSPDKTLIAASSDRQIFIFDSLSGEIIREFAPEENLAYSPSLFWGDSNESLYLIKTLPKKLDIPAVRIYEQSIWHLNLNLQDSSFIKLLTLDSHAIKPIYLDEKAKKAIFVIIENWWSYYNAALSGTPATNIGVLPPKVRLVEINLVTGERNPIAEDWQETSIIKSLYN